MSDSPTVTFGDSAMETVLQEFGWSVDDEGYIVTECGEYAPTTTGEPLTVETVGGVVPTGGDTHVLVPGSLSDISEHISPPTTHEGS